MPMTVKARLALLIGNYIYEYYINLLMIND